MKPFFIQLVLALFLSACGDSSPAKKSAPQLDDDMNLATPPEVKAEPEPAPEPESEQKEFSLNDWVAKLPKNDPRRIRYEAQIQALWKERDKTVENQVEVSEDSLETLQQRLAEEEDEGRRADLQEQIGSQHLASGNFNDAAKSYLSAIETYEKLGLGGKLGDASMDLGTVYTRWRNYAQAEIYYVQAADNLEKVHGAEHPDTVKARQLAMTSKSINAKVRRILEGRAAKEDKQ